MGRTFSRRSLTIAVLLLVSGFEAITPDANDLASSMALRILGMQPADPDRSSDDDAADESGDLAACEILSDMSMGRSGNAARQSLTCPIGCTHCTGLHGRGPATSVVLVPSMLESLHSAHRLNC